ncbi:hypothetical protein B0H10DRAFT_2197740 [Mycena sp. CBHHK59/15]|nr:hypothetical protein B0H10DRAFT_2197740 [Mycena sp. CBHHK59/15]
MKSVLRCSMGSVVGVGSLSVVGFGHWTLVEVAAQERQPNPDQTTRLVVSLDCDFTCRICASICANLVVPDFTSETMAQNSRSTLAPSSLRQPHPHSIDLLKNRCLDIPLSPFDGNVAVFAQLGPQHYFITTNADYVPALPSLEVPHTVFLRSNMRYGTDDPTLWPQQWTPEYCHMPLIAKKGARPKLDVMWWDPAPADFAIGSAVTRGLGRLAPKRLSPFLPPINELIGRCTELWPDSPTLAIPLFGEIIQHIVMLLEQLQTLPTTFTKMVFVVTSLQRAFLELDALYGYMTVYKPRMSNYLATPTPPPRACTICRLVHDGSKNRSAAVRGRSSTPKTSWQSSPYGSRDSVSPTTMHEAQAHPQCYTPGTVPAKNSSDPARGRSHAVVSRPICKHGWAATTLEERHRYVERTAMLMLDWTTKSTCPNIIRRVTERLQWSPSDMQALETAVCRYYTQAFWEYFGCTAVVPMRLDHDMEKEEGAVDITCL